MTLQELESKAGKLRDELDEVQKQIKEERLRLVKEEYGVGIDSMVKYKSRNYRVTGIRPTGKGKPWVYGIWIKKDGSKGSHTPASLWDGWELLTP